MKKKKFNLEKLKSWLDDFEKENNVVIDKHNIIKPYLEMNGMSMDYVLRHDLIVIKDWFD